MGLLLRRFSNNINTTHVKARRTDVRQKNQRKDEKV